MSDSLIRSESILGVMKLTMDIQERHGTKANVELMQGIAIALTALASKQGNQSMECPVARIKEEAAAILASLSDAFQ